MKGRRGACEWCGVKGGEGESGCEGGMKMRRKRGGLTWFEGKEWKLWWDGCREKQVFETYGSSSLP